MKELSVVQKAKAYDEAIERAKKWRNAPNIDKIPTFGNKVIEEIFPELKESEDEKIRKRIIQALHGDVLDMEETTKAIAWIEKQGKKLPAGFYYVNSEGKKFYSDTFKYGDVILHIEKQNEQKPDEVRTTEYWNVQNIEQKPADKVEPKFHKGEWITIKE